MQHHPYRLTWTSTRIVLVDERETHVRDWPQSPDGYYSATAERDRRNQAAERDVSERDK